VDAFSFHASAVLAHRKFAEKLTVMFSVEVAVRKPNAIQFSPKKGGKRSNFCAPKFSG
jgi:hypothetical protein